MKRRRDGIVEIMREQYESRIYSTLLEMELSKSGKEILNAAGLEVTEKSTGEKFTIHSVIPTEQGLKISVMSATDITGPMVGTPTKSYSLEEFEAKFK
jgi:hypothetical protein